MHLQECALHDAQALGSTTQASANLCFTCHRPLSITRMSACQDNQPSVQDQKICHLGERCQQSCMNRAFVCLLCWGSWQPTLKEWKFANISAKDWFPRTVILSMQLSKDRNNRGRQEYCLRYSPGTEKSLHDTFQRQELFNLDAQGKDALHTLSGCTVQGKIFRLQSVSQAV